VMGDEPTFEEFEEENPIQPRNAEFQTDAEEALFNVGAELFGVIQVLQHPLTGEDGDSVLQQGPVIACSRPLAPDQLFTLVLDLFQADDMQEFGVKLPIEEIAVVGKGKFEQVGRGEEHGYITSPPPRQSPHPSSRTGRRRSGQFRLLGVGCQYRRHLKGFAEHVQ